MHHLALQVGHVDGVVVDDPERADPRGSQVQQYRRAEPPGAHAQHPRRQQPVLSFVPDLIEDQVASIAQELVLGELHWGLIQKS